MRRVKNAHEDLLVFRNALDEGDKARQDLELQFLDQKWDVGHVRFEEESSRMSRSQFLCTVSE
jgi:hypothetical protein